MGYHRNGLRVALAALVSAAVIGGGVAWAEPVSSPGVVATSVRSADGSYIEKVEVQDGRNVRLLVHSAAMNKTYPVDVLRPEDVSEPRPVLYLLNGAGGGIDLATWKRNTDALEFLADKNINVVQIIGGPFSFYTDWVREDPVLGVNKWQTFVNEELPPLVDAALGSNGVNAIAGLSMAGTSVLNMAIAKPGHFRSVAVYSGIAQTSDPIGQRMVRATVEIWGGGDTRNMWGAVDDPLWAANDPILNAEKLRGTNIFASTGNGIPGIYDQPGGEFRLEPPEETPKTVAIGGVIEAGVNWSTRNLNNRLNQLGIPATFVYRDTGTHSWGYWQDDLKSSWPVLAKGLYSAP
ncbi:alpha/beta hydrolase [Nocardia bhagyanarayanae]|uniref:S-formylglutathione hydrolase FrmB n=1 Tax=Nocardia bhagyanarayanae TaxID=1215925 RepID=A0A543F7V7_9NOCA|nr:alpha/beta hydrolase family protein [Nocardia bhagyanarayanae]TQM29918.1 S-formylglutathione hydrolase FrmB [Nocardia bhagyanarayanae]